MADTALTRSAAAAAIDGTGWRLLFKFLVASVPVESLTRAAHLTSVAVAACDGDGDGHLRADVRPDRLELSLRTSAIAAVTQRDVELARRIESAFLAEGAQLSHQVDGAARGVQAFEVAIDAMDIAAVVPFWRAVLAYTDEPGSGQDFDAIVDPVGQGPDVWFQQMEQPRPQRNRIHLDITVAHDDAQRRIDAALAAGGTLLSDRRARAFWVLADPEGNEVCVCTWQDRD